MKATLIAALMALLGAASLVEAHTHLSSIDINGIDYAPGDCIRPQSESELNNPIVNVSAADMTCGLLPYAAQPANRSCPITAGSIVTVQYHHTLSASDEILDHSHHGPCIFYLAPLSSNGAGDVWFKIQEDGYHYNSANSSASYWCTDTMIDNGGKVDVRIPATIPPGDYLLRAELIALHVASSVGGAQFYIGCAQLTISGGGTATPSAVALPGAYSATDPGILFQLYYPTPTTYIIPGPTVFQDGTNPVTSTSTSKPTSTATSTSTSSKSTSTSTSTSTSKSSTTSTSTSKTTSSTTPTSTSCSAVWGQCAGNGWTGPTCCVSGTTCTYSNPYYSQCLPN